MTALERIFSINLNYIIVNSIKLIEFNLTVSSASVYY